MFVVACTGVELIAAARSASAHAASTCAGCGAVRASAEHAEIGGHNFKTGALLAFFVLPLARLNAPFDENQRALFQVLLRDLRLLAPHDNLVPLGALLALAIAIFVRFVGGDGKIGDGLSATGVARFRIAAQPAHENDLVH